MKRESLIIEAEKDLAELPEEEFRMASKKLNQQVAEDFEILLDDALHKMSNGPYHLRLPEIRKVIFDSWKWIADNHSLYIYVVCVMSNHVHILARKQEGNEPIDSAVIMKAHKSFTSRVCSKLLNKKGEPFWESNYFDRTVRGGTFNRVMWYILNNPVTVGLLNDWRDWPGTWLNPDLDQLFRDSA